MELKRQENVLQRQEKNSDSQKLHFHGPKKASRTSDFNNENFGKLRNIEKNASELQISSLIEKQGKFWGIEKERTKASRTSDLNGGNFGELRNKEKEASRTSDLKYYREIGKILGN